MRGDDKEDSSDDEKSRPRLAPHPAGAASSKRGSSESHTYELCLVGNLLDLGHASQGNHLVREIPVQLESAITQVSCGLDWICFLTAQGRAYSCGRNSYGQLAQGHFEPAHSPKPLLFPLDQQIVRISCGASHGGVVTESGTLFMFGCGAYGRLGTGGTGNQHTPTQVRMNWSTLQSESRTTNASMSAGIPVISKAPAPISKVASISSSPAAGSETEENDTSEDEVIFADISCGDRHTLVLGAKASAHGTPSFPNSSRASLVKNSIMSFGDGMNGRLGIGHETDQSTGALVTAFNAPQYSKGLSPKITAICAGVSHSAALSSSGELFTWGNGADGQLGHAGSCESEWTPRQVEFSKNISLASVKCGAQHTLAVSLTGVVYTWGRGKEGQLGNGGISNASSLNGSQPQRVQLAVDPLAIHQMNLEAPSQAANGSGSVVSASQHLLQQQDLRVTVRSIVAKEHFCMVLDEHSRLFAWGNNCDQQLGLPHAQTGGRSLQHQVQLASPQLDVQRSRIVRVPRQVWYMDLREPKRKRTMQRSDSSIPSSSRATTTREQGDAMGAAHRQSLVHFDASNRFSLLVFKTTPVLAGRILSRHCSTRMMEEEDDVSLSLRLGSVDSTGATASALSDDNGRGVRSRSFLNQTQMRVLLLQQQQRSRKLVAQSDQESGASRMRKLGPTWQLSLIDELKLSDVPSKESEYYNLMVNYKVCIHRTSAPSTLSTAMRSGESNVDPRGEESRLASGGSAAAGRAREETQRVVASRTTLTATALTASQTSRKSNSESQKSAAERSPSHPAPSAASLLDGSARLSRKPSPRLQSAPPRYRHDRHASNQDSPVQQHELPVRPASAFGRALHPARSSGKVGTPDKQSSTPAAPPPQCHRPARVSSANARTRSNQTLRLRFQRKHPEQHGLAPFGSSPTELHPDKCTSVHPRSS